MENLELDGLDINFKSEMALVCFKKFPNLSKEVVKRFNEYQDLKDKIYNLEGTIEIISNELITLKNK
jgi:hypothetical protein